MIAISIRRTMRAHVPYRVGQRGREPGTCGFTKPVLNVHICRVTGGSTSAPWVGMDDAGVELVTAPTRAACERQARSLLDQVEAAVAAQACENGS